MPAKPLSLEAIRAKADKPTNNLALLPKSFGRFALALSKGFLSIASTSPSFTFEGFCRTGAQLVQEPEENWCLSELLICGELKQGVRVSIDRPVIYGLCDVVFGGVGNEQAYSEARPFSKIERAIVQLFFKTIGRAMPSAFPNTALREFFVTPPQDPHEDPQYPPFKPFVSVKILCNIHGYSGELLIELPEELALQFQPVDDKQHSPNAPPVFEWGAQISGRVETIEVELVAVLAEFQMNLDSVTSLQAGQVIKLDNDIASPLVVCSDGIELFTARLGQTARKFCLSIEAPIAMTQ
ncbi:MAG: FliM/FliN family flagellar motor switch protein [Aestuariivirga sp.]